MTDPVPHRETEPELRPAGDFLLIVFRTFAGYMLLFAFLMLMLKRPAWELSVLDICFWAVVLLLVGLRLRDRAPGGGRFAAAMSGLCLLVWAGVNATQLIR